jgi:hypothetical protein
LIGSGAVHNGVAAITIWIGDDEATQILMVQKIMNI